MAKEIKGDLSDSISLKEFVLLPGETTLENTLDKISLETRLSTNTKLKFPFIPSAMRSVVGYEMAIETARNGMLAVVPCNMSIREQVDIVRMVKEQEVKQGDVVFHDEFVFASPDNTLEQVMEKIEKYGHSTIPIVDKYRKCLGVFIFTDKLYEKPLPPEAKIREFMIPLGTEIGKDFCRSTMPAIEVKEHMLRNNKKFMPILDNESHLLKIAFIQKLPGYLVGAAIDTHQWWDEKAKELVNAGVDMLFIDSSDGYTVFQAQLIQKLKIMYPQLPVCGGNIITAEGFDFLVKAGADAIKVGMGIGSICITTEVKKVGRGQAKALIDVIAARDRYEKETGMHIPIIADGGISTTGDMVIALSLGADALMMGRYFNRFYEAAGRALTSEGTPTDIEELIAYKEIWGEGSTKAKNLARYGHKVVRTFFAEGVEGRVEYAGRLKPNVEGDARIIRSAMCNAGCKNLEELRKKAVLERLSQAALMDANAHGIVNYKI